MKTIYQSMVKCGRANCRKCPHGPYFFSEELIEGKMKHKYLGKYLKPEDLDRWKEQKEKKTEKSSKV